jgi:hypothetical protein
MKWASKDVSFLALQAHEFVLLGYATPDLVRGDTLEEAETATQEIDDRTIRHGATVGGARRLQHLNRFGLEAAQKLVEQPGFAHAGIAHEQRDGALPLDAAAVDLGETLELEIPADQRRQAALLRDFQPGSAAELSAHGIGSNGLGLFPWTWKITEILEDEEPIPKILSPPARDDLTGFGDREQPGRDIGRVADRRVVHAEVMADRAHDHWPVLMPIRMRNSMPCVRLTSSASGLSPSWIASAVLSAR